MIASPSQTQEAAVSAAKSSGLGLMPAIGWGWALAVWGYALAWFLLNDRIKLAAYRILDPEQSELAGRK